MNTDMSLRKYSPLWNKYRPAILKMLVAANEQPQQYKLMGHEVANMDRKKKSGFGFTLKVSRNRATNNIKESEIAQDLLNMLQQSPKGSELLHINQYEIVLDKQFTLHVSQVVPEEAKPAEVKAEEVKTDEKTNQE